MLNADYKDAKNVSTCKSWRRSAEDKRCLESEDCRGQGPDWAVVPQEEQKRRDFG